MLPQSDGGSVQFGVLGLDGGGAVAEAGQIADALGELLGIELSARQQTGLARVLKLNEALTAKIGADAIDIVERMGFEE